MGLNCKSKFNGTRLATRLIWIICIFKSASLVSAKQALQTSWFTLVGTNSLRLLGKSYLLIIALTFSLGFSSEWYFLTTATNFSDSGSPYVTELSRDSEMISIRLASLSQRDVTSLFISDVKSSSVPLGESDLSLASTVSPRETSTLATFVGSSSFCYSITALRDIRSPLVRAASTCSFQEFMLSKLFAKDPRRISELAYWSFLVVACIHWFPHDAREKTGYKIQTKKNYLSSLASTAVRKDDLKWGERFVSIIPDYLRGILREKGFDYVSKHSDVFL